MTAGGVFSGTYCALLTAMRSDAGLDLAVMSDHIERLLDQGIDGLVALGTTGEFSDLTSHERDAVVNTVVQAVNGRVPVIAGVGALGTAETCAAASRAAAAGVDGVLALPALYWEHVEADLLFRHFTAVAEASTKPVLIYDYPAGGRPPLEPGVVCDLADEHPGIVGIKQTVTDVSLHERMCSTVKARGSSLALGVGYEHLALPSHLLGGRLLISGLANFCTPLLSQLTSALDNGDADEVLACHATVLQLSALYRLSVPPISAIKQAAALRGMPIGPTSRTPGADPQALHAEVTALLSSVAIGDEASAQNHPGRPANSVSTPSRG